MDADKQSMDAEMEEDSDEGSSQNSNSPEPLTDEEVVEDSKIAAIEDEIKANPYLYESHVQLIKLRRKRGDLDEVRKAREDMSTLFPLTPELWIEWLTDEEKLAATEEEKKAVIALCERAVKDYTSVSVWLEYVQFMIGQLGSELGSENVRATFEKALSAVGIHVTEGSLIWDAYREFELAILSTIVQSSADLAEDELESKLKEQKNRIYNLYKRQLSVPLLHIEKTFKEFQEMFPEQQDDPVIKQQYQKACRKLEAITPFEDELFSSEAPHLDEYKKYIQYEKEKGDPVRVQILYERAILENCLLTELWIEFTKYLDSVIKVESVVLPAHERAIRNCPWSLACWKNYTMALERHSQPHGTIKDVFEKALSSGFTSGEEYKELWLGYLDYLRRRIKWDASHDSELNELNDVFERAIEHMTYFPDTDEQHSILQYRVKIEAKFCKNVPRAREIWNEIMNYGHNGEAEMWIRFSNFERKYGDDKHYRKLLLKALHNASDWPESIGSLLLNFEREEGTLESLDVASERYENRMQCVQERRQRRADKEAEKQQLEADRKAKAKAERRGTKQGASRSSAGSKKMYYSEKSDVQTDSDGFKIPSVPKTSAEIREHALKRSANEPLQTSDNKRSKEDERSCAEKELRTSVEPDLLKDERTVFLSNLTYTTEEAHIKEMFSEMGSIEEIRMVRDYKGRSKGYCYVVYSNKAEAQKALKEDRAKLNGRPVFVSPCHNKKSAAPSPSHFKFGTGLEKNKLFVKNLPFDKTEEDLKEIFKEHGDLKEVRLVTYRNGHSKGLAYVEYEKEADAASALVKTDSMKIGEHIISVAISNPPVRKPKQDQLRSTLAVSSLLGGRGSSANTGPRGKGRTQVSLLPRAVQRSAPPSRQRSVGSDQKMDQSVSNGNSSSSNGTGSPDKVAKLSNADFRDMLLKKS